MKNNENVPIIIENEKLNLDAKILIKIKGTPPINHVSGLIDFTTADIFLMIFISSTHA
jgi:hypothetical protein